MNACVGIFQHYSHLRLPALDLFWVVSAIDSVWLLNFQVLMYEALLAEKTII